MSKAEIKSVANFLELTSSFDQRYVAQWFYRGVGQSDRKLIPGLFRIDLSKGFASWQDLESYILKVFQREAKPFHRLGNDEHVELLCLAQHHGLPTRLLDWTTNPLVALFFATQKFDDGKDSAVWCYGFHSTHNCHAETTILERRICLERGDHTEGQILFPQHISQRITNQSGCFTVHQLPKGKDNFTPFEESGKAFGYIEKIVIPAKYKKDIFVNLHEIGYHYGLIYPGLDGIAKRLTFEVQHPIDRRENL